MSSPYAGLPPDRWPEVTKCLLDQHPLSPPQILEVCLSCWGLLWQTTIGPPGEGVPLGSIDVPATVVGYFLERLIARRLSDLFPGVWRGGTAAEKDLVFSPDHRFSVEIKCSGQRGVKVYGNRSYGQDLEDPARAKKSKSGYYITVNFCRQALLLVRFGWIDEDDWRPQKAPSGQMAGLGEDVYAGKLVEIDGDYRLLSPVAILSGVGPQKEEELRRYGVETIGDLLCCTHALPKALRCIRERAERSYRS